MAFRARQAMMDGLERFTSLQFTSHGGGRELELQWREKEAQQGLFTDRLLATGAAAVHVLLTFALLRQSKFLLAALTFATAIQQLGIAFFVSNYPKRYMKHRHSIYTFNIVSSMISMYMLASHLHLSPCASPIGGALFFWFTSFVTSGLPWFALHAMVYPLPMPQALIAHLAAISVVTWGAPGHCEVVLSHCSSGGSRFVNLQLLLSHVFNILTPVTDPTDSSELPTGLSSCVTVYVITNIVVYVGVMHIMWLSEHSSRLTFLASTEEVDVEWSLEKMGRPTMPVVFIGLELMLLLMLLVQVNEFIRQVA